MAERLQKYFPMIRTREEILKEIWEKEELNRVFVSWDKKQQENFLDFCSGARGVKVLYDSFFKIVFDPDTVPQRLEELLSLLLRQKVKIISVLPGESGRIAEEGTLLVLDIVVQLSDGSIANVECQKIGYAFPGQRAACYSADLLMRLYRRVKRKKGRTFTYRDIRKVYLIVFFEQSPFEFRVCRTSYVHYAKFETDTGVEVDFPQEFVYVALDIYLKYHHNKDIGNKLEAWLTFLGSDRIEDILVLIEKYPEFQALYEDIYAACRNTERVMEMYSRELAEIDRNTVQYMIDEMQAQIEEKDAQIEEQAAELERLRAQLLKMQRQKDGSEA